MLVDIDDGTLVGKAYLIRYSEDLWKSFTDESRDWCKSEWTRKAMVTEAKYVVLKLEPDELFPVHGHEVPYVEWQIELDRPNENGFEITIEATVTIVTDAKYLDPVMRADISRALEAQGKPGMPYVFVNSRGEILGRGKL